jgi:DHA1 family tetracycline resistance protein-like MFS transporter
MLLTMPAVFAASLVVFLEVVSFGAIFPVLPDYCLELGGSKLWVGVLFAFVALPRVVTNTLWGKLSDRFGRRPILGLITAGTLSGSVLWALAPTLGNAVFGGFAWLAISRIMTGIFQAQAALTQAIAADVTTPDRRAAAMGILGAAFGAGIVAGITMGGYIGHHVSHQAVGWASAAAQIASLSVVFLLLRETHPAHRADRPDDATAMFTPQRLSALLAHRDIQRLLIVWLVAVIGQMVMVPTLRLISRDRYGYDLTDSTSLFIMWAMIGVVVQGGGVRVLAAHIGERPTFILGLAGLAVGLITIGLTTDLAWFWGAMAVVSVGTALATPALSAMLSQSVGSADQGAVQGLNQSVTALGRGGSYLMAGLLYAHFAPGVTYTVGGIFCALAVGLLVLLRGGPAATTHPRS